MASRFLLLSVLLLFCLTNVSSDIGTDIEVDDEVDLVARGTNRRLLPFIDCGGLCKDRCSLHSRPNLCKRACGTCCVRCKCVPRGTAGNREMCGTCYADMVTHANRTKCP